MYVCICMCIYTYMRACVCVCVWFGIYIYEDPLYTRVDITAYVQKRITKIVMCLLHTFTTYTYNTTYICSKVVTIHICGKHLYCKK